MKHIYMSLPVGIMLSFVTGIAGAQPTETPRLTLQEAIRTALEKHPTLQSAEFAVQGAEATGEAGAVLLLSSSGRLSRADQRLGPRQCFALAVRLVD